MDQRNYRFLACCLAFLGCSSGGNSHPCAPGGERCACYGNGTCDQGLECRSDMCVSNGTNDSGTPGLGGGQGGGASNSTGGGSGDSGVACTPAPPNILAWWPGDGNAKDVVGDHDGVLTGATTFESGHVDAGFRLVGASVSGVLVPSSPTFNIQQVTIEAWVFPRSYPNEAPTILRRDRDANGNSQYILALWNTGQASCNIGKFAVPTGGTVSLGIWSHVACTYDGSVAKLYVNGALVSEADGGQPIPTSSRGLGIGTQADYPIERQFDGTLDEVTLYSRSLSASEITAIFGAGSAGKCRP